LNKHVDVLNNL